MEPKKKTKIVFFVLSQKTHQNQIMCSGLNYANKAILCFSVPTQLTHVFTMNFYFI